VTGSWKVLGVGLVLCLLPPLQAQAQSDLRLTEEEADSAAATYDHFFPIWGKKVVKGGFDIPYPFGISGNFLGQRFDVTIDDLQLSLGAGSSSTRPGKPGLKPGSLVANNCW
jgi:hypothetical protein